jgi:hypothetical protein
VLADLAKSKLLLLGGLLKFVQVDLWVLWQSQVGQPIDRAVAVPPN